jgi:hypothetical protein
MGGRVLGWSPTPRSKWQELRSLGVEFGERSKLVHYGEPRRKVSSHLHYRDCHLHGFGLSSCSCQCYSGLGS